MAKDKTDERPTDEALIDLLKKHGLSDEEIAKLGNDPDQWASLNKQHEKKVIKVNITIPEGTDRELTPEEFAGIFDAAKGAINEKMLLSTGLSVSWSVIKTAVQMYLNKQSGGLVG